MIGGAAGALFAQESGPEFERQNRVADLLRLLAADSTAERRVRASVITLSAEGWLRRRASGARSRPRSTAPTARTAAFYQQLLDTTPMLSGDRLVAMALVACAVPAWRAARVNPGITLRSE
jgi:hypothetical protein